MQAYKHKIELCLYRFITTVQKRISTKLDAGSLLKEYQTVLLKEQLAIHWFLGSPPQHEEFTDEVILLCWPNDCCSVLNGGPRS